LSRGPNVLERLAFLQHAPEITVLLSTADRGRAVEGCLSHDEIAAARLLMRPLPPTKPTFPPALRVPDSGKAASECTGSLAEWLECWGKQTLADQSLPTAAHVFD